MYVRFYDSRIFCESCKSRPPDVAWISDKHINRSSGISGRFEILRGLLMPRLISPRTNGTVGEREGCSPLVAFSVGNMWYEACRTNGWRTAVWSRESVRRKEKEGLRTRGSDWEGEGWSERCRQIVAGQKTKVHLAKMAVVSATLKVTFSFSSSFSFLYEGYSPSSNNHGMFKCKAQDLRSVAHNNDTTILNVFQKVSQFFFIFVF